MSGRKRTENAVLKDLRISGIFRNWVKTVSGTAETAAHAT